MDEGLADENIEKVTKAINGGLNNIDEEKTTQIAQKNFSNTIQNA
jgi:predicted chitinase